MIKEINNIQDFYEVHLEKLGLCYDVRSMVGRRYKIERVVLYFNTDFDRKEKRKQIEKMKRKLDADLCKGG